MEGIGLVFPLRAAMKESKNYFKIFTYAMYGVGFCCLILQIVSYMAIGENIEKMLFYNFGKEQKFIFFLEILYAVAIFFSYPLNLFPVYDVLQNMKCIKKYFTTDDRLYNRKNRRILRVIVLFFMYIICFIGPDLVHFIGFIGAFVNSFLGFIVPI